MENKLKTALDKIKAEESLIEKTEEFIMNSNLAVKPANNVIPFRKKNIFMKRLVAVACAVILLCCISAGGYAYYKTPTSYLSLDINPSVELGINSFGKVVTVTAYNDDGQKILEGQNVLNMDVGDAVTALVKSASQNGYIKEDGSTIISVTSVTDSADQAKELEDEAEEAANNAVDAEGDTATVIKDSVPAERQAEAEKLGITPGKLNLIQKLQELDPTITVDQYKDKSVREIQKKFVELKKQQKNGVDTASPSPSGTPGVSASPSASPSPSSSPSPSASPSSSPDITASPSPSPSSSPALQSSKDNDKESDGKNNNGNGNSNDDGKNDDDHGNSGKNSDSNQKDNNGKGNSGGNSKKD